VGSSPNRYNAMASSLVKMGEDLPEVPPKGVEIDRLGRKGIAVEGVPFASALGEAHLDPIGRPVAGPFEARGIDEALKEYKGMVVEPLPVLRKDLGHSSQQMRGQMGDLHPGEDKETDILSKEMEVSIPMDGLPSNEPIPAGHLPGRGPPTDAGQGSTLMKDHVFEVLPHGLAVAQIVIGLHEPLIERLPGGGSNHNQIDGTELMKRTDDGTCGVKGNLNGPSAPRTSPAPVALSGRKPHKPRPLETQKKLAAGHRLEPAVSLPPSPKTAKLLSDKCPASVSMFGNDGANKAKVTICNPSAPDDNWRIHGPWYSISSFKTPVLFSKNLMTTFDG